ncbi:hypothetical protein ACTFIZ_005725 [Dictyostelium cf. discoideum]
MLFTERSNNNNNNNINNKNLGENEKFPKRKYKDYVLISKENGHGELFRFIKEDITANDGLTISSNVLRKVINDVEFSIHWDEMHKGHLGRDATYQRYKSKYYCTGMWVMVDNGVKHCDTCQRGKVKGINKEYIAIEDTDEYSRMVYDLTSLKGEHTSNKIIFEPADSFSSNWDIIESDNSKEPCDSNIVYILVCIDSFTKFATGRCLTSKKAVPIYNFLAITYKDKPIMKWHCDNGKEFKNKVFDQFRQFAFPSSKAAHGAPRTPTTQGMVERLNQEIKKIIRNLKKEEYVPSCLFPLSS